MVEVVEYSEVVECGRTHGTVFTLYAGDPECDLDFLTGVFVERHDCAFPTADIGTAEVSDGSYYFFAAFGCHFYFIGVCVARIGDKEVERQNRMRTVVYMDFTACDGRAGAYGLGSVDHVAVVGIL